MRQREKGGGGTKHVWALLERAGLQGKVGGGKGGARNKVLVNHLKKKRGSESIPL